jgi:predicted nucleic acid-binding protein
MTTNKKPKPPLRIYWDSCVYIHRIQKTANYIKTLELLGNRIESGELILVASTLCITEVGRGKSGRSLTAKQLKTIQGFFENSYIDMYPVSRRIAEHAAEIARRHQQKPSDAIHLATAVLSDEPIHQFHTYDRKLLNLNGKLTPSMLSICHPNNDGWQGRLNLKLS